MHRTRLTLTALTALTLAAPLAMTVPAQASNDVVRRGTCSGSTHWKIKAKPDNGRIEVEAEIDSNHNGQAWTWVLRHNGTVASRGSATTHAPSGSFFVVRRTANAAGVDSFKFRAVYRATGEVCVARVSL